MINLSTKGTVLNYKNVYVNKNICNTKNDFFVSETQFFKVNDSKCKH